MKYTIAALAVTTLAANATTVTTAYGTVTGARDGNQAGPMWGQFVTADIGATPAGPHGTLYLQDFSYQAADNFSGTQTVYLHAYTTLTTSGTGAVASIGGFNAVSASTLDLTGVAGNGIMTWTFSGSDAFDAATSYIYVMSTSATEITIADTSSLVGSSFALDLGDNYGGGDAVRGNAALDSGWDQHFEANFDTVAVPEPSSTAFLGLGGLALILRRRK